MTTTLKQTLNKILPWRSDKKERKQQDIQDIILAVAKEHDLSLAEILGDCRRSDYVFARAEIAQRAYPKVTTNKTEIGRALNRDHSTIIHYLDEIELPELKQEA